MKKIVSFLRLLGFSAGAVVVALAGKLQAAEIQGVSIAAVSAQYSSPPDMRFATNLVSGIGLFGDVHGVIGPGDMWLSSTSGQAATNFVVFNLGGLYTVNALKVWNYNETASTEIVRGMKSGSISYSTNGVNFTTNIAAQSFTEAPGTFTAFAQIIQMPSPIVAQYVRIDAITNWATSANGVGLSKVRFISNTNPPTVLYASENYGSNQVTVYFSESVDPVSGTNATNYSLTCAGGSATILNVIPGEFADRVILQTSRLTNQNYSLVASGVYDEALTTPITNNTTVALEPEVFLWLMSNQGVETNSSGTLTEWVDQSAYGHNAVPTNIFQYTTQPTFAANVINGLPSVQFNGTQVMCIPNDTNNPLNGDLALVMVVDKTSAVSAYGDPISKTGGTYTSTNNLPAPFDFYINTTAHPDFLWGNGDGGTGPSSVTATGAITLNSFYIISLVVRATNGVIYLNGSPLVTGSFTAAPWDAGNPIFLGVRDDSKAGGSGNITFQGYLTEVMLIHGTVTAVDLNNVNNYLGQKYGIPIVSLGITEQPASLTAQVGKTATFWVNAVGVPPITYQWRTNGAAGATNNITGATSAVYTTPALTSTPYNGLNYSVVITSPIGSITSSPPAVLTVVPDTTPPAIFSATKTAGLTNVLVVFSEAVSNATALNAANYSLTGGASVLSAKAGAASNQVSLTTTALSTNLIYRLAVQNVQDLFTNTIAATNVAVLPANLTLWLRGDSGVITNAQAANPSAVDEWLDQTANGNNAVQYSGGPGVRPSIGNDPADGASALLFNSSSSNYLSVASVPSVAITGDITIYAVANFSDYSTYRSILGKDVVNQPASYDFYTVTGTGIPRLLRGNGALNASVSGTVAPSTSTPHVVTVTMASTNVTHFLDGSTNGTGVLNTNMADGGTALYIGSRNDLSIFMNGDIAEVMIFSNAVSATDRTNVDNYLGAKYFPFTLIQGPTNVTTTEGQTATFSVVASQGSAHLSYQWVENSTNIPNANSASYTTGILSPSDNGDTFYVQVSSINATNTVGPAMLTVQNVPPTVTSVGEPIWSLNTIVVIFSEAVSPAMATNPANYSLNNGATVLSAAIGQAPNEVVLTTSPLSPGVTYTLTIQNVQDLYGNTIVTVSIPSAIYPPSLALWVSADNGVTADGSGNVLAWADQSTNANNFSAGIPPVIVSNAINGLPVIRFNATNETFMSAGDAPSLEIVGNMTILTVVNFSTYATNGIGYGIGGGEIVSKTGVGGSDNEPGPFDYYVNIGGPPLRFLRGNGVASGVSANAAEAANTPTIGVPHLLDVVMQGTTVTHRLDGTTNGTGTWPSAIADSGQPLYIGTRADGVVRLDADMAELLIFGSALSSNDVFSLENYFGAKYGLPLAPVITMQPVAATNVDQFGTLVVPAAVAGASPLFLQWYDTNNVAVAGQTNATLVISNISANDSYYLNASNAFGSTNSTTVAVTLLMGLTVDPLTPASLTNYAGSIVTYAVTAFGTAPIYYQWLQDGVPVADATNSTYTLVVLAGANTYSCTVSNDYNGGTTASSGTVTLIGLNPSANLYTMTVLSNNPLAYWRLNETNGSTIASDQSGNGHTAAYTNVLLGVLGFNPPLDPDTAAQFGLLAASNSYAGEIDNSGNGIPNIDFSQPPGNNAEFSVEAWVKSTNTQVLGAGLVAKGYGNGGEQFDLDVYTGFRFFVRDASGAVHGPTSTVDPVNGQWYHLAGVCDEANGAVHLYVNGVDVADSINIAAGVGLQAGGVGLPGANLVSIGARTSASTSASFNLQFDGVMDEVALYNYALSPSQVEQDYQIGSLLLTPSLAISKSGAAAVQLSWNAGVLQSATNLAGPFINLTNAISPYTVPASNAQQFYRVLNN